jgi:hypothetical protein
MFARYEVRMSVGAWDEKWVRLRALCAPSLTARKLIRLCSDLYSHSLRNNREERHEQGEGRHRACAWPGQLNPDARDAHRHRRPVSRRRLGHRCQLARSRGRHRTRARRRHAPLRRGVRDVLQTRAHHRPAGARACVRGPHARAEQGRRCARVLRRESAPALDGARAAPALTGEHTRVHVRVGSASGRAGAEFAYRALVRGGWRDVPEGQRWWEDVLGGEVEAQRVERLKSLKLFRDAMEAAREVPLNP